MSGGWKLPVLAGGVVLALWAGALFVVPYVSAIGEPPAQVERQEAEALLDAVLTAGVAHDFAALCAVEQEPYDCEEALAGGAGLTAPRERPTLVEARQVGGFEQLWLFSVKGRDGKDRPYASEVLVTEEDDELKVVNAVWWTGRQLGPLRGE